VLGDEFPSQLAAARGGDDAGFAALWRDLQPPLLRYLGVGAAPAAEDLASETWACVAQGLARFDGDETGFRAWVFTIARHRLLDWRRREARARTVPRPTEHLSHLGAADDPAADALEHVSTDGALALIAQLPADQAEVVMLRAVAGLDVARVAKLLGKRPGAVRVLAHRGLRRLAELLAVDSPHDDPSTGVLTP
jgi:RNA polymerase sigma-70 factor (ECF subfamily)